MNGTSIGNAVIDEGTVVLNVKEQYSAPVLCTCRIYLWSGWNHILQYSKKWEEYLGGYH